MRYIKVFENQSKYNNVIFDIDNIDDYISILDIITKYYPFDISGYIKTNDLGYEEVRLELGKIIITGKYDNRTETFNSVIQLDDLSYNFNLFPYDTMGGLDIHELEKNIGLIYDQSNTFTISVVSDGYVTHNIVEAKSLNELKEKLDNIGLYLIKGGQIEGKQVGKIHNGYSDGNNNKKINEIDI